MFLTYYNIHQLVYTREKEISPSINQGSYFLEKVKLNIMHLNLGMLLNALRSYQSTEFFPLNYISSHKNKQAK